MQYRPSRIQIENRIYEISTQIAAARQWGSVLTALEEERRHLLRELRELDNGPQG
jgi:hypothetical protein